VTPFRAQKAAAPLRKPTSMRKPTPVRGRRQGIGIAGALARILAVLVLGWCGGFLWFSLTLPNPAPLGAHTDAVVVLTGGKGRLKRGLAVIEAGSARRMLVSGVDRYTTRKQLAAAAGVKKARLETTDLGYEAVDTRSNAEETTRWVKQHGFTSIRLVTSAGHMRRARLELARVLPASVTVVSDAVPVEPQAPSIATEYSKYLLRRAALALGYA
jgi:uncharacterized SAM-binding protein YcdF (DUF218 family)